MQSREDGAIAVVAVVLMVAITILLGAMLANQDVGGFRKRLERESEDPPPDTGLYATHAQSYVLEPLGPDAVPLAGSKMVVTADGVERVYDLAALAPQLPAGATQWKPGQSVCIAGAAPGCLQPAANAVAVRLVAAHDVVADLPALPKLL